MAKNYKETAAAMLARTEEPQPEPKKETKKTTAPKKASGGDPAVMFDNLTEEQKAELIKHINGTSKYDSTGNELRTQRLNLVLRPSIVKRAKEAATATRYKSLTDFIEEALEEKLERI